MIGQFVGTALDGNGKPKRITHFNQVLQIVDRQKEVRLRILLKAIGHPEALDFLKTYNVGAGNLYHNTKHCIGVAHYALEIAPTESLSDENFAGLVLGALFHDFHHTGGNQQVPDLHNIEAAVSGLLEYKAKLREKGEFEWLDFDKVFMIAEACIRVTEFPFVHEPATTAQQIIRDADLLYASASADTLSVLEGLRCEISKKIGHNLPLDVFVKQQREFLKSATFYTEAGRAMFDAVSPLALDLLEAYANPITDEDHNE